VSPTYPDPWPADPAHAGDADPSLAGNAGPVAYAAPDGRGPDRSSGGRIGTLLAAAGTAVVVAGVGPLLGWLWAELAPRIPIVKVDGGFVYAEPEPEQAVAADGWFAILAAGAGVLLAVLAWVLLRRYRGVTMVVALALGSLVSAALALWMGHKIGAADFAAVRDAAAVGDRIEAPLTLRITNLDAERWWLPKPTGVGAVQALVAVFTYTCLAGFSSHADLRGRTAAPLPASPYLPPQYTPAQYTPAQYTPPQYTPAQYTQPQYTPPQYPPPVPPSELYGRPPEPYQSPDQFGPGRADSSEGATGTART
jgi:hypothetical protein